MRFLLSLLGLASMVAFVLGFAVFIALMKVGNEPEAVAFAAQWSTIGRNSFFGGMVGIVFTFVGWQIARKRAVRDPVKR